MSKIDVGGSMKYKNVPEFPGMTGEHPGTTYPDMTLRDWFAGHSPYNADHAIEIINGKKTSSAPIDEVSKTLAKLNYAYADAMLAERSKS